VAVTALGANETPIDTAKPAAADCRGGALVGRDRAARELRIAPAVVRAVLPADYQPLTPRSRRPGPIRDPMPSLPSDPRCAAAGRPT
jgi:hypothetical protein